MKRVLVFIIMIFTLLNISGCKNYINLTPEENIELSSNDTVFKASSFSEYYGLSIEDELSEIYIITGFKNINLAIDDKDKDGKFTKYDLTKYSQQDFQKIFISLLKLNLVDIETNSEGEPMISPPSCYRLTFNVNKKGHYYITLGDDYIIVGDSSKSEQTSKHTISEEDMKIVNSIVKELYSDEEEK